LDICVTPFLAFPLFATAVHRRSLNAVQSYSDNRSGAESSEPGSEALLVVADGKVRTTEVETGTNVRELIAIAEDDLRAATGLHVSSKIASGDWEKVLIAEARGIGADCIFVSSGNSIYNNHHAGERGTVSAALLNRAPCSVEVVR